VEGLVPAKDVDFERVGLPAFVSAVYDYVKKGERAGYNVILNATGGYKPLSSAMTIVGLITGLEIIYLFEESEQLVTIPPLPLHVNIPAWTQVESVVDLLENRGGYQDNKIYEAVKDKTRTILIERDTPKVLKTSTLVKLFQDYANRERGKPELIIRTENSPLLNFLTDEQKAIFLRITEIGHLIWKGDRVPEMADHALRHHSDIFHLAERLLLRIFYYKEDFLNSHELFVLLCALYLHDCGHVIGAIKKEDDNYLSLLPTEIRDHHHVLGYLRLKYPQECSYLGYLIYDHLCDTKEEDHNRKGKWNEAWNNYLHAVATLGLYHRKKMKLKEEENYEFFKNYPVNLKNCDKDFPCLEKFLKNSCIKVFGNEIKYERAALLVALLRIIDSLDEQVSRTGDVNDIRFHLAQLKAEAKEDKGRADNLGLILEGLNRNTKENIDRSLEQLKRKFEEEEGKNFGLSTKGGDGIDAITFRDSLKNLISDEQQRILALEYASASVGHFFKEFQKDPYTEKAYIRGISIRDELVNEKVRIKIDLDIENDSHRLKALSEFAKVKLGNKEINMESNDGQQEYKKAVLEALKKEYLMKEDNQQVVKDILNNAGIELQYGNEDG
jgi:hypothetical protein